MSPRTLVLAVRVLARNPLFTAVAVLTISLGVGTSTAIFSVANAVLLRLLPYREPGKLVIAGMELRQNLPFSNADFIRSARGHQVSFLRHGRRLYWPADRSERGQHAGAASLCHRHLTGARVMYGRDFNAEDGVPQPQAPPGGSAPAAPPKLPPVAILSYKYFMRRFGGNQAVIGQTMQFSGGPGPVIAGALAPGFHLYFPPDADEEAAPEIWMANRLGYDAADRISFSIRPIGRLRDGIPFKRAQEAADIVAADGRKQFPIDQTAGYYINLEPLQAHLVAA
ncbi:ADOP family protein [Occallatibacter riparius]|uniref:ABC transporter permease n=1 Tax=Occallatibacter riparius TaxID=1002689 RepID=A0A9J7BJU7_9BACT|nr:ABC transporter permease [Occallatibacter riparius]UWZ82819.1 ABC transporter permease [Occallatibacter riparius]